MTQFVSTIARPDHGVPQPDNQRPYSFAAQVAALLIGESASKVAVIDVDMPMSRLNAALVELRAAMRNNTAPSVRQAAMRTGGTYRTEVADVITTGDNFYVAAIVTRLT